MRVEAVSDRMHIRVVAVSHYRPDEKDRYHMPVCVGDTVHIVEEDDGTSNVIGDGWVVIENWFLLLHLISMSSSS